MEAHSFARRLRSSKILRYNPRGVPVTVTTPPAWASHDEYGLKSRLPSSRRNSPYVQITDFDNDMARPTWRPATQDALFAQRWEESGLGAAPRGDGGNAAFVNSSDFVRSSVPTDEGLTRQAEVGRRRKRGAPDFAWLTDRDFERYLDRLRDLRPAFREFCEREASRKADESLENVAEDGPRASTSKAVDLYRLAQTETERGDLIVRFLSQQSEALNSAMSIRGPYTKRGHQLQPYVHPVLGLQYAPPSAFHNARFAEPIPARLLARAPTLPSNRFDGYLTPELAQQYAERAATAQTWSASAMGVVATVDGNRTGAYPQSTEWLPDETTGYRDNDVGKGLFRVEVAEAETRVTPRASHRRTPAEEPWLFERTLDALGGFRNLRPEGGVREWLEHPGVPEVPVRLELRRVDEAGEASTPVPGTAAYVSGNTARPVETRIWQAQPVRTSVYLLGAISLTAHRSPGRRGTPCRERGRLSSGPPAERRCTPSNAPRSRTSVGGRRSPSGSTRPTGRGGPKPPSRCRLRPRSSPRR
jgi:hypothetical protein